MCDFEGNLKPSLPFFLTNQISYYRSVYQAEVVISMNTSLLKIGVLVWLIETSVSGISAH
jgi:hypothetical protein